MLQFCVLSELFEFVHLVEANVFDRLPLLGSELLLRVIVVLIRVIGAVVHAATPVLLLELLLVAEYLHSLLDLHVLPRLLGLNDVLETAPEIDEGEELAAVIRVLLHLVQRGILLGPLKTQVRQLLDPNAIRIEIRVYLLHCQAVEPLDHVSEMALVVAKLSVNWQPQRLRYFDGSFLWNDHIVINVDQVSSLLIRHAFVFARQYHADFVILVKLALYLKSVNVGVPERPVKHEDEEAQLIDADPASRLVVKDRPQVD